MTTYEKVIKLFHEKKRNRKQLSSVDLRQMAKAMCEVFDKELKIK